MNRKLKYIWVTELLQNIEQYVDKETMVIFKSDDSRHEKAQKETITRRVHCLIKQIFNFFLTQFPFISPFRIY